MSKENKDLPNSPSSSNHFDVDRSERTRSDGGGHITRHAHVLSSDDRVRALGQRGVVLWMTGLSGSGKSTIAMACEAALIQGGHLAFVLDGDNIRSGLNSDLGFSPEDREENQRRIAHCAALFGSAGFITFVSFISPMRATRQRARQICKEHIFLEVYVSTSLSTCEARDPKNLYQKARTGELPNFTGISAPYEPPLSPDLILDGARPLDELVQDVLFMLQQEGLYSFKR